MELDVIKKELEKFTPLEKEVEQLIKDYTGILISQDNLPDVEAAFKTVKSKRIDLDKLKKSGISEFEDLKKQFRGNIDILIEKVLPLENSLKSEIISFNDESAWKKAVKGGKQKDFESYLKVFNSPKYDFVGKYVLDALQKIEEFKAKAKNQQLNFTQFKNDCFNILQYKTSQKAQDKYNEMQIMLIEEDKFGEFSQEIISLRGQTLENLKTRVEELKKLEEKEEESKRIEAIKLKIVQLKTYFNNKIKDSQLETIDAILKEILEYEPKREDFEEFFNQIDEDLILLSELAQEKKTNLLRYAKLQKEEEEQEKKQKELEEQQRKITKEQQKQEKELEDKRKKLEEEQQKQKQEKELQERTNKRIQELIKLGFKESETGIYVHDFDFEVGAGSIVKFSDEEFNDLRELLIADINNIKLKKKAEEKDCYVIDGGLLKKQLIIELANYNKTKPETFFDYTISKLNQCTESMQRGKGKGKIYFDDLTKKQQENIKLINQIQEQLDMVVAEIANNPIIIDGIKKEAINLNKINEYLTEKINNSFK